MWVAFEQRAIHKCARVALVCVADYIFVVAPGIAAKLPFAPSGESGPAAPAQPGLLDCFDDSLWPDFERFYKPGVAIVSQIVPDVGRVNEAAVA